MEKVIFRIYFIAVSAASFIFVSCNTDDVEINAKGIHANYSEVMVSFDGNSTTALRISSFHPWEAEFENPSDQAWLKLTETEGSGTKIIGLTGELNPGRRRSAALIFRNEYSSDRVVVIQHAPEDYEPGAVIYTENFGSREVEERTAVADFKSWGAYGSGFTSGTYTATDGWIQSGAPSSEDYDNQPHETMSGGNNLELAPGGVINAPRLGRGAATKAILTLYVAAWDGAYLPMEQGALTIEGNTTTDDATFSRLPLSVTTFAGWQKVEVEFEFQASSTNFYLRIANNGTQTIYIDDITLEPGGRGTQVVGDPTPNVTTGAPSDIDYYSAVISGSYIVPENITVTEAGFEWKAAESDDEYTIVTVAGTQPETEFSYTLDPLTRGTTYVYRAYTLHGDDNKTYGDERTFTTLTDEP